jgi:hypothetical protein
MPTDRKRSMHFFHLKSTKSDREIAYSLFPKLGVPTVWEHESSNYPPNCKYFRGKGDDIECRLCVEDSAEHAEYQYRLTVVVGTDKREFALPFVSEVLDANSFEFEAEASPSRPTNE